MKYHFRIHKEKSGYWAESIEEGLNANTQADTIGELYKNMKEALELCLEEPDQRSTYIPPLPDSSLKGRNIVEVSPDPHFALAALVRRHRLLSHLSQRQAAQKLGIKHLSQYQRLEKGKTANPELGTLVRLKKLFPDFSVDAALA